MAIGVRELRDTLSRQLARVREGHTVVVTDHGRPIARLVPMADESAYGRLVAAGHVVTANRPKSPSRPPAVEGAMVSDLVDEQRG